MQKYNIFVLRRKKAKGLQRNIFFIWASRRGLGGDAFKRRKRTFTDQRRETLASPAAPSGFPLQCFLPSVPYVQMIIRTHNHIIENGQKTFPLQSLSHTRPQHHPISRRTNQSPRPNLFSAPRTSRPDLLTKKMGTSPASGYRYATANAV